MIDRATAIALAQSTPADHRANCRRYPAEAPLHIHGEKCAVNVRDQILGALERAPRAHSIGCALPPDHDDDCWAESGSGDD